jgi:hypothetical protein
MSVRRPHCPDAGGGPNTGYFDENHQPKPPWEFVLCGAAGVAHHLELTRIALGQRAMFGEPKAMSMNMAATLRVGRWSFRISASLPTSTLRSRVCSPGMRIRGMERASVPRRKAYHVPGGASARNIHSADERIVVEAVGRTLPCFQAGCRVEASQSSK